MLAHVDDAVKGGTGLTFIAVPGGVTRATGGIFVGPGPSLSRKWRSRAQWRVAGSVNVLKPNRKAQMQEILIAGTEIIGPWHGW